MSIKRYRRMAHLLLTILLACTLAGTTGCIASGHETDASAGSTAAQPESASPTSALTTVTVPPEVLSLIRASAFFNGTAASDAPTVAEMAERWRDETRGHYTAITDTESEITFELTDEELRWWSERLAAELEGEQASFSGIEASDGTFAAVTSPGYDELTISCNRDTDADFDITPYLVSLEAKCALCQLFAHPDEAWHCAITIINSSTGEVVSEGSERGIELGEDDWQRS